MLNEVEKPNEVTKPNASETKEEEIKPPYKYKIIAREGTVHFARSLEELQEIIEGLKEK
jgi:L-lysine 2,3-aminomutase